MRETQDRIVLGTDSGTFWTGGEEPWTDDPEEARAFSSPRKAWEQAERLQEDQAEYLEGSPVELHIRDPEGSFRTHRVTSLTHRNNRPALRRHWRDGLGEALPPDLPSPDRDGGLHRLEDYLVDVDWDALRTRHGSPERVAAALDSRFLARLQDAADTDPHPVNELLRQHAPRDVGQALRSPSRKSQQAVQGDAQIASPEETPAVEDNEVSRDRAREHGSVPSPAPRAARGSTVVAEAPGTSDEPALPAFVRRHFVRAGDKLYYRKNPDQLAFETRGEMFRAHDSSLSVATAMVELAESRGWSALKVRGTKDFRRLVWAAAAKRGMVVDGYAPTAGERAMLEPEGPANRGGPESRTSGNARERSADALAGTLHAHGAAPFQHDDANAPSYFVSLRSPTGDMATYWGKDLERAMREAGADVGDRVQLARRGKRKMQVREPSRNDSGIGTDHQARESQQTAWSVTILERDTPDRTDEGETRTGPARADLAAKVVELFTAERLAMLPPEDRARFRELYDQAKTRLEDKDRPGGAPMSSPSEVYRGRNRDRTADGR
jgi:hypothetical protein